MQMIVTDPERIRDIALQAALNLDHHGDVKTLLENAQLIEAYLANKRSE